MAFCINCGVQNPEGAVFCGSCGQPIFREPRVAPTNKVPKVRAQRVILAVLSVVFITAVLTYSIKRAVGTSPSPPPSAPVTQKSTPIDEAVLTIVGMDRKGSPVVQGSGFILTADGLGGTNYHVLKGTSTALAECCNGRDFEIRGIEGADLVRDLVVFQLYERGATTKPQDLPHVTLGSSKDAVVGERVIAIGSPQGLENTVSDGIVSAIREDESIRYLQITAPIRGEAVALRAAALFEEHKHLYRDSIWFYPTLAHTKQPIDNG